MRVRFAILTAALAASSAAAAADEAELLRRLEQQQRQIEDLQKQVHDMAAILANRVAKVEAQTAEGKVAMTSPTARVESSGGDFSLQVVGTLQPTFAAYRQSRRGPRAPQLEDGTEVRRAHLGVQGTAFRDVAYVLVLDGAAGGGVASAVRDATIQYTGLRPFTITLGNQKPQAGFDSSFSDRSNAQIFLEPALPAELMNPQSARFIGARVSSGGERYSASVGLFGDDIANSGIANPVRDGWGVHGRLTLAPINAAGRLLHVGASGYWRRPPLGRATPADPPTPQLRFRARPEAAVDGQRLVDTGNLGFARSFAAGGAELAVVWGALGLQSEYVAARVSQSGGRTTLDFDGGYVGLSYALTGESRTYDGRNGTFGRFRPARNLDPRAGAWGAWEVAARLSTIDLNDAANDLARGGVRGGRETNLTLGINWHLSPFTRLMANYIRAEASNLTNTGLDEGTNADIFGFRVHQEW